MPRTFVAVVILCSSVVASAQSQRPPLAVVVMLDMSANTMPGRARLMAAVQYFLFPIRPPHQAKVGAFNDSIELMEDFTSDRDTLIEALGKLGSGNGTRLYDAIAASLDSLQAVDGRRVILLVSDGADTESRADWRSVLEQARAEDVTIYVVYLESRYFDGVRVVTSRPDRNVRRLAEETGGNYVELNPDDDLDSTFISLANELYRRGPRPEVDGWRWVDEPTGPVL